MRKYLRMRGPKAQREHMPFVVRAASLNEELKTCEAVIATEGVVRNCWGEDEILMASGAKLPAQVPLMDSHDRSTISNLLGSVRNLRMQGTDVVGTLHFDQGEKAQQAFGLIRDGHLTDLSVGARVNDSVVLQPGEKGLIENVPFVAGTSILRVITAWEVKEASLVAVGADPSSTVREYTTDSESETVTMDEESVIEETTEEAVPVPTNDEPIEVTEMKEEQVEQIRDEARAEAQRAERERIVAIQAAGADVVPADEIQRAISEGMSVGDAKAKFLDTLRSSRQPAVPLPNVIVRDREITQDVLGTAMVIRAGIDPVDKKASEAKRKHQEQIADQAQDFAGWPLRDICREALSLSGRTIPVNPYDMIRSSFSTSALSGVFSAVVNKTLMSAFEDSPDSTLGWVQEVDVPDFKQISAVGQLKTSGLTELPSGAEADNLALGNDTVENYSVKRYAGQFTIDERDIVNDDLGALTRLPVEIGQAAARLRPDLVYSILLANGNMADGNALFEATYHKNLVSGTSPVTALQASSVQTAIQAMRKQTMTVNGSVVNLNIIPEWLIVPPAVQFDAEVLLRSVERVIASASGGTFNPLRDRLQLAVDARLENGVTDPSTGTAYSGSTTAWFLAANPNRNATIQVAYLTGSSRRPRLRSFNLTEGKWGIGWDITHDVGAKAVNWRGLYKSAGA